MLNINLLKEVGSFDQSIKEEQHILNFLKNGSSGIEGIDELVSKFTSEELVDFYFSVKAEAGEFYSPKSITEIIRGIVSHEKGLEQLTIFEPTIGSGNLVSSFENCNIVGCEVNDDMCEIAETILKQKNKVDIAHGSTFDFDWSGLNADVTISNPPYSLKWDADKYKDKKAFSIYPLAPKGKADFAFVLEGLSAIKDDGLSFFVLPHGVLFRGGREGDIRKMLIEQGLIDAIIALPEKLFANTAIPTCILVMRKQKKRDGILFIDASGEFVKKGKVNEMTKEQIQKVVDCFLRNYEISKYSYISKLEEVAENDYNLNVSRYVDTYEPEPVASFEELAQEAEGIGREIAESKDKLRRLAEELGDEKVVSVIEMLLKN